MPNLVPFNIDLTAHEGIRLAAVLDALGPYWQGGAQSRFAWSEAVFEPRGRSDAMG